MAGNINHFFIILGIEINTIVIHYGLNKDQDKISIHNNKKSSFLTFHSLQRTVTRHHQILQMTNKKNIP